MLNHSLTSQCTILTESEQAVMDFSDGDFDEPMDDAGIVAETLATVKDDLKSDDRQTQQEDSEKTDSCFL